MATAREQRAMGEVIRREKNGKFIGWYIRYYDADGKRRIKASKQPTHNEARRMLLQIEAGIARGEMGVAEPRSKITVAELCSRFLNVAHPRAKSEKEYRRSASSGLNRILPLLGTLRIDKLRRRDIENARDKLSLRYKPNTVRSAMRPLGAALTWAVQQDLIAQSPMYKIVRPRLEYSHERLTTEEASALLAEAKRQAPKSPRTYSIFIGIALALRLGLRRGEIFGLRWEDVDLKGRRLTVARSFDALPKNGKVRTLPIPSALLEDLERWRSVCPKSANVVPIGTNCRTGLARLLSTAGCKPPVARLARTASHVRIDLHRAGRQHPGAEGHARPLVAGDELGLLPSRAECAGAGCGKDEVVTKQKAHRRSSLAGLSPRPAELRCPTLHRTYDRWHRVTGQQ